MREENNTLEAMDLSEDSFTGFKISKIENNVIWVVYTHEGKPIYSEPIAACLREYVDRKHGLPSNETIGERAFEKLKISKAFEKELLRA